jgi:hypothetical protein
MKILCDKYEFALLVRECQRCDSQEQCVGCLFIGLCGQGIGMDRIEDICEIEG